MYQPLLNLHTWVSLPNEVRFRMRRIFNIPQSGNVLVNDGRIETDGVTAEDISNLTVEKMQSYAETEETDFNILFNLVVKKVENELLSKSIINNIITNGQEEPQEITKVKKGNRK